MKLDGLDHVAITVSDLLRSMAWYGDVLGLDRQFEKAWGDYPIVMLAGESGVALFPADTSEPETVAEPRNTIAMRHFAFRVDRKNFEAAQERMRWLGVEFREDDHGVSRSIYIHDPDGHEIEITTYEV
jgi:catechol 2,3-dioxygenase-like lactoylglutathione lyase family enzyme